MENRRRISKDTDDKIDFTERQTGKLCERCKKEHTHFVSIPHAMPKYYCAEHLPENKEGWLYKKRKESYIKAMELGKSLRDDWATLSNRDRYRILEPYFVSKINKGKIS